MVPSPDGTMRTAHKASWRVSGSHFEVPGDINQKVAELFNILSDDFGKWKDLATRLEGQLFVGLQLHECNEGIGISAETLCAIGQRGLELELDIYSGKEENFEAMTISL